MENLQPGASDPLAQHNAQFSKRGMLLRYARGRVATVWPRILIGAVVTLFLSAWFDPGLPLLLFSIYLLAEAAETVFLYHVPRMLDLGMSLRSGFRIASVFAVCFALSITAFAAFPFLYGLKADDGQLSLPILFFSLCGVLGPALAAFFDLRYHRVASLMRIGILAISPVCIAFYQQVCCKMAYGPQAMGLLLTSFVTLFITLVWTGTYIHNRQKGAQRSMRSQALQRQALADAYMRLYDQKQEARRLALIAENANDSVMLLGREGEILWANEAFARITGYAADEVIGKSPCDILHLGERVVDEMSAVEQGRKSGQPFRMTLQNRRKDGPVIWLDTNQVPVFDEQGELEAFIAVERDITAIKHHAEQLEAAKLAAEEGARVKEEFLATMSHEFRTPMNGVLGMAQLLQETTLNEAQREYIDTIQNSSQALLELINDVLDLSKMNASGVTLSETDFEPRTCFSDALRLLRPQAREKGLKLALTVASDVPLVLRGDHLRLRQIVVNLVGNAIKFTEKGSVEVSVMACAESDAVRLGFEVTDTGIGIAPEQLDRIFQRFSQADAAITRNFGGTGLGLPISRHLAEAMGGTITVRSVLGQGATFAVDLLLRPTKERPKSVPTPQPEGPTSLPEGVELRVLVAEDNRVNRLIISKFLDGLPVELIFAEDGEEAVSKTLSKRPHLVLMDVSMPRKNGLEATRDIRAQAAQQPYISALTANVDDDSRKACTAAGMDGFLSKPLARRELVAILLQVAEQSKVPAPS